MDDLISRRAANEAFWRLDVELRPSAINAILKMLDGLPPVQPEIIRCEECKYRDPEDHKCDCGHDIIWQLPRDDKWYCADAERRTDE